MKIGILTFHWATNYGAVLQAYALQHALKELGNDVEIIDYYPSKYKKSIINALKTRHLFSIPKRIRDIDKEKNIEKFRNKYLIRTEKYYSENKKLHKKNFDFDCYICGSDQIWNSSFIEHGEKNKTFSYYFDFVPETKIIASYAASFGVVKYKESLIEDIKKYLKRFDFISVREQTGVDIIENMGLSLYGVVPDPTLLLKKEDYKKFLINKNADNYYFVYMLHGRDKDASELIDIAKKEGWNIVCSGMESIEMWLTNIFYSDVIITNSFHGIVFSIIFQKPFVAILIEGSGMNDRLITLLRKLGLEDRIYNGDMQILKKQINWEPVNEKLKQFRQTGFDYIREIMNYKKGYKHEN